MCIGEVAIMNIHNFSSDEQIIEYIEFKLRGDQNLSAVRRLLDEHKGNAECVREIRSLNGEVEGLENDKKDLEYNIYSLQEENNHMERNLEKQEKEIQLLCGLIVFLMLFAALGFALLG